MSNDSNKAKALYTKINDLKKEFDKLRDELTLKVEECGNCIQQATDLSKTAVDMNADLESKLASLSDDQKAWRIIKVKLQSTAVKGKVVLDVGGKKFSTSVETLTWMKDSFFTALLSEQWEIQKNQNDESIFIDRDGELFTHILTYMRTKKLSPEVYNNDSLREFLMIDAEYFHLQELQNALLEIEEKKMTFPGSSILNADYRTKLNEFFGKREQKWELIYKATRDGFEAAKFHSLCDNKGPTMTIIQSTNGSLFGSFANVSWNSSGAYINDTAAFLFTLKNPHGLNPTKYPIKPANVGNAVYGSSAHGPTFGGGHDIYIASGSNANNSSYTNFSHSYNDITGKGNNTFVGAYNFMTTEIEVYKLA